MIGDHATIAGRIFPAGSSRRVEATLTVTGDRAVVTDEHGRELAISRTRHLKIEAPVGSAPRRITFRDGALFETDDNAGVERIEAFGPGRILHRFEAFDRGLVWVVLGCFAGLFLIWRYALPGLVTLAIWATPPAMEQAIDEGTLRTLDLTMAEPSSLPEADRDRARALFDRLLDEIPSETRADFRYRLLFRDIPGVGPNAFALPGGTVVLTDALVTNFPDDDLVGGVLAHEIGHVTGRHGLGQLYRSLGIYVLIALIAGDTGPILEEIVLEGNLLLSLAGSREHEREADDFGIRLAEAAGLDPRGLLEFFDAMPDDGGGWMSTHPGSGERAERIRDFLESR